MLQTRPGPILHDLARRYIDKELSRGMTLALIRNKCLWKHHNLHDDAPKKSFPGQFFRTVLDLVQEELIASSSARDGTEVQQEPATPVFPILKTDSTMAQDGAHIAN